MCRAFVFMHPFFHIFNRAVSGYAVMGITGFLCSLLYVFLKCKKRKESFDNAVYILVFAFIAALIGAKVLYLLVEMPSLIQDLRTAGGEWGRVIYQYLSGGMVFYGGLLGGILGAFLSAGYFCVKIQAMYDIFVPAIPLFAGFGRLGCLMMGCCYGKETDSIFGIVFQNSPFAPNHVRLIPTELYEALFDFALAVVLMVIAEKRWAKPNLLQIYLVSYASFRFVIEFFRGDTIRGIFLLSTSQWISLAILLVILVMANRKQSAIIS